MLFSVLIRELMPFSFHRTESMQVDVYLPLSGCRGTACLVQTVVVLAQLDCASFWISAEDSKEIGKAELPT
jgi:hypothetical protein